MAELYGLTLTTHLDNIFGELQANQSIYGYPLKAMYRPPENVDLSTTFHGKPAATPLGPASGPHTQMVQNLILSFLGGCRIMELKTVQILDELEIPRPCIDARTVGYNVEWSQEMKLNQSYHEYVTAWVILHILEADGCLGFPAGHAFYQTIFDMSVGYDLKGISSPQVTGWIENMLDASPYIERLLGELPEPYARFRDLKVPGRVSDTLTLSTFHGCPRDEIRGIVEYLIDRLGLDVYVKMNPTQLGYEPLKKLLTQTMGYAHVELDPIAFEEDLQFDEGIAMMRHLVKFAKERNRRAGAKFTNTLVVKDRDNFFKDEVMYLSGTPLHVISMNAMNQFRQEMGPDFPVSFSAGVDQHNFVETVSCGMVPVTVCTDFLQKGGYTRGPKYLKSLAKAIEECEGSNLADLMRAKAGDADLSPEAAGLTFAGQWVPTLAEQTYYHHEQNRKPPKKVESKLVLFDCLTCNICLPVCPNAANISLPIGKQQLIFENLRMQGDELVAAGEQTLVLEKKAQIANLADFCNECGNCEVFCPELGGPQIEKPRFFSSRETYELFDGHDGFLIEGKAMSGRLDGVSYKIAETDDGWYFTTPKIELQLDHEGKVIEAYTMEDMEEGDLVDLQPFITMKTLLEGVRQSQDYAAITLTQTSR